MASATQTQTQARPPSSSGIVPYRLTARQFEQMIDAGVFRDEDHVELLGGLLVDTMVKKDPHNFSVGELAQAFRDLLTPDWIVREEKSVILGRFWRPEPDVAVARGPRDRYRSRAPRRVDLGLLAEVADASYPKDRGTKWCKYAASGVAVYWIVNLLQRQIEVYTSPSGRGKAAAYQDVRTYGADDEVPVVLDGRELGRIKVGDVLP
jgi:Uma2 family endonuclease